MSAVTQSEAERSPWCSICYHPLGTNDLETTLIHVLTEHPDHPDVTEFVDQLIVGQHCYKCVTWFYSDVRWSPTGVFMARPLCEECRETSRALENLMTERLTIREIVGRAWLEDSNDGDKDAE